MAASTALHLGLGETDKNMCAGTQGCLLHPRSLWGKSSQPLLTSSHEQPYLPHPMTRSQDPLRYHRTSLQPWWWTELDHTEGRALTDLALALTSGVTLAADAAVGVTATAHHLWHLTIS